MKAKIREGDEVERLIFSRGERIIGMAFLWAGVAILLVQAARVKIEGASPERGAELMIPAVIGILVCLFCTSLWAYMSAIRWIERQRREGKREGQ